MSEKKRYTEMTRKECIEDSDKVAVAKLEEELRTKVKVPKPPAQLETLGDVLEYLIRHDYKFRNKVQEYIESKRR